MEWNKEKTLLLIQEFHQRPGLWNMTHEDYRKKETKRGLLEQIAAKFNNSLTAADIERKFHTLRTQYHREINRMYSSSRGQDYKSKWFAFPHLLFLNDPSACRNTKDTRRRNSSTPAKILYLTNLKVEKSAPTAVPATSCSTTTVHNVQVAVADKQHNSEETTRNMRKDLREIFEEAVDSEDDKTLEQPASTVSVEYLQTEAHINAKVACYEEEHLVDMPAQEQIEDVDVAEEDTHFSHHVIEQQPPVKMMKLDHHSFNTKRTQEICPEIVYEATQQSTINPAKRIYKDAQTTATSSLTSIRDEFSVYGEYVANELRSLTDRQILVSVKHKINTALFEANVAQLQKNGDS